MSSKGGSVGFSLNSKGEKVDDWIHQEIEDGLSEADKLEERQEAFQRAIQDGMDYSVAQELYLHPGDKVEHLPIS